jgi:TATA-binding protein-associated factor
LNLLSLYPTLHARCALYPAAAYSEVAALCTRVKAEAEGLRRAAVAAGAAPVGAIPSPAADGFGAEHAVTLAAAVPQVGVGETEGGWGTCDQHATTRNTRKTNTRLL